MHACVVEPPDSATQNRPLAVIASFANFTKRSAALEKGQFYLRKCERLPSSESLYASSPLAFDDNGEPEKSLELTSPATPVQRAQHRLGLLWG